MLYRSSIGAIALALGLLASPAGAQVFDLGRYPDLSGQWLKARNADGTQTPKYNPTKPYGRGQEPPLREHYRLIHEASLAEQAAGGHGLYRDSAKCIPQGMPFTMSIVFPFEFVLTERTTFILFEITTSAPRRIYTDGRAWPEGSEPTFQGYSIGKWIDEDGDGKYDVLEVETRHMRVPRIYDQSGIPFHEDGQAIIKERIYLDKTNPNLLHNEMTTTDNALTRPWSVKKSYVRLPKIIWTENNCTEGNDNIILGNEEYLLSPEGLLMPVKKGQKPRICAILIRLGSKECLGGLWSSRGTIRHHGSLLEQCRYAYDKIKRVLAHHGADLSHAVKVTTYITDLRLRGTMPKCVGEAWGDITFPAHTLLGIGGLAFPEMLIEIDVTAIVAAK